MGTWNETSTLDGPRLLPEGTRQYTITAARPEIRERDGKRIVKLELAHPDGSGSHEIPTEPWASDHASVEMYETVLKTWAAGLGFQPAPGTNPSMAQVADQFCQFAPSLLNAVVELNVQHKQTEKVVNGETKTYTNARVYLNDLVSPGNGTPTPSLAEQFAPIVSVPDDLPF
jgi:hypothetical protein